MIGSRCSRFVAHQSRGLPIASAADERLQPFVQRGRELYERRQGQLALSCADCHDRHRGQRLGGSVIPGADPTGYPIYRLEWQAMGSLQRRLRNCMTGVRAEPYPFNSPNRSNSNSTSCGVPVVSPSRPRAYGLEPRPQAPAAGLTSVPACPGHITSTTPFGQSGGEDLFPRHDVRRDQRRDARGVSGGGEIDQPVVLVDGSQDPAPADRGIEAV